MIDQRNYECAKCDKSFKLEYNLRRHLKRKTPCDKIFKCEKCNKIFKNNGSLNKHLRRKNPCEPILGNTQEPLKNPNTCHFCYREFKNKYTLRRHFNTCKIRNGNMPILFQKIKQDRKLIEELRKENKSIRNIITNNVNNVNNTNNIIQFNIGSFLEKSQSKNLIEYGHPDQAELVEDILMKEAPQIIKGPLDNKVPVEEQMQERIFKLIRTIHRNPQFPQLHNIFTQGAAKALQSHTNPQKVDLYLWFENRWNLKDWGKVRVYLLEQIISQISGMFRDKLKIKKNITQLIESDPRRKRLKPDIINEIFETFTDSRDSIDILFLKIALILDKEDLLNMDEMNRLISL